MKFKVGEKVKAKGGEYFNKGEIVEIINVDSDSASYLCKGETGGAWQCESDLEPLDSPITFQQKLDRFKREPIGFLVKSKEIADELAKVFEREGMECYVSKSTSEFMVRAWDSYGKEGKLYVSYNYPGEHRSLSYGLSNSAGKNLNELIDITLEELKSYNANTLEDKLALFKAGTHVFHTPTQEIYDKLMVELEKRGYVWASKHKPTAFNNFSISKHVEYDEHDNCLYGSPKLSNVITLTTEDFSTPQVITITSDGYHRVTAESNGITAEALCNPTNKFSISKGSHMALKRLLEKLDEDTIEELWGLSEEPEEFNLGDVVEVVRCDFSFADEVKGAQGVITSLGDTAYKVKFPVKFSGDNTWSFYDSELKLVRKYNA